MNYTRKTVESLLCQYGLPLYIFDEKGFVENYNKLYSVMSSSYGNYRIAYSYKTNYTPYICKTAKRLGAYAEVVSGMEYNLAKQIGYDDQHIIFNGPDKGLEGFEAFKCGSLINADSLDELTRYCEIAKTNPERTYKIGLRVNLDIGQNFISRFGMDEEDIATAFQIVSEIRNLKIAGLHCHISRCRSKEAWKKRTEYMLHLADSYFVQPPEYIDLGSGMFGSMAPDFAAQFDYVPTYEEYADVTAGLFATHYSGMKTIPVLFTEPGTTLINRFIECITRVDTIKKINNHFFAVLNGSIHNLGETSKLKRLPVQIIPGGEAQVNYEHIDFTGYTCLEQDVLLSSYKGVLAPGDYAIFGNVGGYSTVLKPPFIQPDCAMLAVKPNREYHLIKTAETYEDIFKTYIFEDEI